MGSCSSSPIKPAIQKRKEPPTTNKNLDTTITKNLSVYSHSPIKTQRFSKGVQTSQKSISKKKPSILERTQPNEPSALRRQSNSFSPLLSKRVKKRGTREIKISKNQPEEKLSKLNLDSSINFKRKVETLRTGNNSFTINRTKMKLKILGDSFNNSFNSSFNKSLTYRNVDHLNKDMDPKGSKSGFVNPVTIKEAPLDSVRTKTKTLFNLYEALEENEDDENYVEIQEDVKEKMNNSRFLPLALKRETPNNMNGSKEGEAGGSKVIVDKNDQFNFKENGVANHFNFSKLNVSRIKNKEDENREAGGEDEGLDRILGQKTEEREEDNCSIRGNPSNKDDSFASENDMIDCLSNKVIPSEADPEEIREMMITNRNLGNLEDGFSLKNDPSDAEPGNPGDQRGSSYFSSTTSSSSGLFFEIPTPGISESRDPFA